MNARRASPLSARAAMDRSFSGRKARPARRAFMRGAFLFWERAPAKRRRGFHSAPPCPPRMEAGAPRGMYIFQPRVKNPSSPRAPAQFPAKRLNAAPAQVIMAVEEHGRARARHAKELRHMLFMGIDVGTQGVRCVVANTCGEIAAAHSVPFSFAEHRVARGLVRAIAPTRGPTRQNPPSAPARRRFRIRRRSSPSPSTAPAAHRAPRGGPCAR